MSTDFEVYAVRHGQSEANAAGIMQGQTSTPLSELGRRQAGCLAQRFAGILFTASYASDLERAMETARLALPGLPPIPCPELREWNLGIFQGHRVADLPQLFPEEWRIHTSRNPGYRIPGNGESALDVEARATDFLERLAATHNSGNILVVTHHGLLDAMMKHVLGFTGRLPLRPALSNASLSRFRYRDGAWQLVSWNDTGHLDKLISKNGSLYQL